MREHLAFKIPSLPFLLVPFLRSWRTLKNEQGNRTERTSEGEQNWTEQNEQGKRTLANPSFLALITADCWYHQNRFFHLSSCYCKNYIHFHLSYCCCPFQFIHSPRCLHMGNVTLFGRWDFREPGEYIFRDKWHEVGRGAQLVAPERAGQQAVCLSNKGFNKTKTRVVDLQSFYPDNNWVKEICFNSRRGKCHPRDLSM